MSRKPFGAMPIHRDLKKDEKPTLGEFAADLYRVHHGTASNEYSDPDQFEHHSFQTESMKLVMDRIQRKLKWGRGDAFINIVTPFGGGKTHAMIAAYHNARRWGGINTVVLVGTHLDETQTLWGEIERQLNNGIIESMGGMTSPGVDKLTALLQRKRPVLILVDELLAYDVKAAGVRVGETTLATQVTEFLMELSEAAAALDKVCIVASFPSSSLEFAGNPKMAELADGLLRDMRQMAQRKEHTVSPLGLEDVPNVVRRRLFDITDDYCLSETAESIIEKYAGWCAEEGLIPSDDANRYEERFRKTYPFTPDVIDTLYNKWGSFRSFQRTRGVLRLLALVIHSLKNSNRPYVTLADFDLTDTTIREMLMLYTGDQTNSVLRNDIAGTDAIADRTEHGTRCATAVFMMSYAMEGAVGATMADVKRAVAHTDGILTPQIADTMDELRRSLHYMKEANGVYKFTQELNLNSVMTKMLGDISDDDISEMENSFLKDHAGSDAIVWPDSSMSIPDGVSIKYVVLRDDDRGTVHDMMWHRGAGTRTFKNSVIVVCPDRSKRDMITSRLKAIRVRETILGDKRTYTVGSDDGKRLKKELMENNRDMANGILNYYSIVYVPGQNGPERVNGIQKDGNTVVERVLNRLRNEHIHQRIDPELLRKSLGDALEVRTAPIYEYMLNAPGGRLRPVSRDVVLESIKSGIADGLFGLGYKNNGGIDLMYYRETPKVTLGEDEYILIEPKRYQKKFKPVDHGQQSEQVKKPRPLKQWPPEPPEGGGTTYREFRMDLEVNSISELRELLGTLDGIGFSRKKHIVVECVDGTIPETTFEDLKKSCLKLDPKARVTSYI